MRPPHVVLALTLFALMGLAAPALADIPPRSAPCKCSTPGVPSSGAMPVALLLAGALVLATRKRDR